MSYDNAPFSFALPNGGQAGMYVEFWRLWSETNGIPVQIELTTLENGIAEARAGHAIFGGLFRNTERATWADFSVPIHRVKTGVLYRRDANQEFSRGLAEGLRVSAERYSYQASYLQQEYPQLELRLSDGLESTLYDLVAGNIDAVVGEIPALDAELSRLGLHGLLVVAEQPLMENAVHAVFAANQPGLLAMLNTGIENMLADDLVALEKKWLPAQAPFYRSTVSVPGLTFAEQTWLMQNNRFTVGIDDSWYPFEFRSENGNYSGISAAYVDYLRKALGLQVQVLDMSWNQAFDGLKTGDVDLLPAAIRTRKRLQFADFTDPYFATPTAIVVRQDGVYGESMESLAGKKLGLVRGFAIVEFVAEDYPLINVALYDSIIGGLEALEGGEIDAYVGALAVVNYEIARQRLQGLQVAGFAPYQFEISMAVNQELQPLVGILNKTIAQMDEREKAAIANDWLSVTVQDGFDLPVILRWAIPIVLLLVLIILAVSLFNRRLQREIESRRAAEEELKHRAQHDPLTELPNRILFEELSHQALLQGKRREAEQAFLFLDIDGFKRVNDNLGHKAGDQLLVSIAQRFRAGIRDSDILARIGGDEFVIHLVTDCGEEDAVAIAQKIIEAMNAPFELDGCKLLVGASIGIALYPRDGTDVSTLVQKADSAMYSAKAAGKNVFRMFSEQSELVDFRERGHYDSRLALGGQSANDE